MQHFPIDYEMDEKLVFIPKLRSDHTLKCDINSDDFRNPLIKSNGTYHNPRRWKLSRDFLQIDCLRTQGDLP